MPINYFIHDQAPALTLAGSDRLGAGVAGLGRGIGNLLKDLNDQAEQKKQESQLTTSMRKMLSIAYPDRKDEFNMMTLPDLQGTLKGEALRSAVEDRAAEGQRTAAALRKLEAEAANEARVPAFLARVWEMGQDEAAVPLALSAAERTRRTAPVTPQGVLKAAAEVGYVPNMERIAPFLKAMGADATDADGGPVQAPVEGELAGGGRWYGFPGTKIRGVREGMPSGATEIPGLPGFRQFGSRAVPLRTEHTGALRPVLDPVNGQAIPGFGMDAEGRVHDFRTQIQKAAGEERGGGALELPRGKDGKIDAGKLKKGQSYNSAKGVVTWDGSKFVGQ